MFMQLHRVDSRLGDLLPQSMNASSNADQPGGTGSVVTDDQGIESIQYYKNAIWFSFTDGCIPVGD